MKYEFTTVFAKAAPCTSLTASLS